VLVIIHFAWSLKADISEPLLYGSAVFALLIVRLPAIKQWFTSRRKV
jgi:sulfoxide reductase heme-binding subunit YedZ